jgi:hypothetical protein
MAMTFDNQTIRSWAMKRPESAPTWWSRMAPSAEREAFGKILFRGKQGLSEPMKAPTPDRHERAADYIRGNAELRDILSAEINEEIARITDQIREGPAVLEPVPPAPEPAREALPAKAGKAERPEKPGKVAKPSKAGKGGKADPAKDGKPGKAARDRKKP